MLCKVTCVSYNFLYIAFILTFLAFFSAIMYSTRARVKKVATEGKAFLRRECDRVKPYYKKVADMIEKETALFRRKTNERVRRRERN